MPGDTHPLTKSHVGCPPALAAVQGSGFAGVVFQTFLPMTPDIVLLSQNPADGTDTQFFLTDC